MSAPSQYSLGKSKVVTDRSASVMIHNRSRPTSYADKILEPNLMAAMFSAVSPAQTVPKSPDSCRARCDAALMPCRSRRSSAPGVATMDPNGNSGGLLPVESGDDVGFRLLSLEFIEVTWKMYTDFKAQHAATKHWATRSRLQGRLVLHFVCRV